MPTERTDGDRRALGDLFHRLMLDTIGGVGDDGEAYVGAGYLDTRNGCMRIDSGVSLTEEERAMCQRIYGGVW